MTWLIGVLVPLVALAVGVAFVSGRHRAVGLGFQHELRRRWRGARRLARRRPAHLVSGRRTA